ncbi:DUF6901 family protein [Ectopseudomonas guguanensis]|jgi:hypothetical protein|uniref:DUF6901 family protein n=1 Tax=Ectopseudomonas guguanensis TaxID=1198456 RepID=UPI002354D512|nr:MULTISPECIES: hypothetical protein [Pseudomonas]
MVAELKRDALIHYEFRFADGRCWQHDVFLTALAEEEPATTIALPDWTGLSFHQCDHCPLKAHEVPRCPFAMALLRPVEMLTQRNSYEGVEVVVHWRGREIRQHTTLQRGLGSLLGVLGATSGCPHTRMMKAMAWFHLPFSTSDETLYRALGTYLLGQFLRAKRGQASDWSLQGLRDIYRNLRQVNLGMSRRLRAAAEDDSSVNGLILLDLLAADTLYALDQYEGELDLFFQDYFDDSGC